MASVACAAITSQLAPPTEVESIQRGVRPRYSPTSIGGMMPVEVEPSPSMSAGVRPASATARLLAWAISPYGVADGTLPTSDSATPAVPPRRPRPRSNAVQPAQRVLVHLHHGVDRQPFNDLKPVRRLVVSKLDPHDL